MLRYCLLLMFCLDAGAQVDHDAAGRGYRVPGHRHQPPGRRGLGDDAELLRSSLYARPRETGEV